jgi:hypothetical protein
MLPIIILFLNTYLPVPSGHCPRINFIHTGTVVAVLRIRDVLFRIPEPEPTIFFSSRILHENFNANLLFSCFLSFQEQSLSLGKKDSGSEIRKNSSQIRIRNTAYWYEFPLVVVGGVEVGGRGSLPYRYNPQRFLLT